MEGVWRLYCTLRSKLLSFAYKSYVWYYFVKYNNICSKSCGSMRKDDAKGRCERTTYPVIISLPPHFLMVRWNHHENVL